MKARSIWQKYMLHPFLYMTATRLMVGAIFLLVLTRFFLKGPSASLISGFLAVFFALCAYLIYLRMDGMRIPRMKFLRPKKKADPMRSAGDIADHMDDDVPVPFDELENEEKDLCSFLSAFVGAVVFTACSFLL